MNYISNFIKDFMSTQDNCYEINFYDYENFKEFETEFGNTLTTYLDPQFKNNSGLIQIEFGCLDGPGMGMIFPSQPDYEYKIKILLNQAYNQYDYYKIRDIQINVYIYKS
jgi:hypothetical protein